MLKWSVGFKKSRLIIWISKKEMISEQHTQECLSRSFIHAIAGAAGVNLIMDRAFDYGFDGTFRPVVIRGRRRVESGFPVDFQLKCTKNWSYEGDELAYKLETKTYNDLVTRDKDGIGAVLILLCVPDNREHWVAITEDSMSLQRCCYYKVLAGTPVPNEASTKKILISRKNVLTAKALSDLLEAERKRKVGT